MSARIIDGKALAAQIRASLGPRVARAAASGQPPGLAVVLVGDDPASAVYVRNKVQACEDVGIRSFPTACRRTRRKRHCSHVSPS